MDDFTNALSALGVAAPAPSAAPSNNPGNLRPQGSSTGFQQFATPEDGLAAMDKNLQAYHGKGINTINGLINRWAPPSENNTPAYVSDVSKRLGIAPDAQIDLSNPIVRHALTTAITLHENGSRILTQPGKSAPQAPVQQAAAQPAGDDDFSGALSMLNGPAQAPAQAARMAPAQVEQTAQPALIKPGAAVDPRAPISSPAADLTLNQITGLGSTVAGGVAGIGTGLYKLAKTGDVNQAIDAGANTVKNVQQAGTYQPRTEQGAKMVEQFGSNWNPLSWIPNATQAVGDKAGSALEDAGHPVAGALVKGAGAAAPLALGLGAKSLSGMLKGSADAAEIPKVEPTLGDAVSSAVGGKPRYKLGADGKPALIEQGPPPQTVNPTITPAGQGPVAVAASPAPTPKPTLAQATPELQQAVSEAQSKGVPVPQDVLARHVEADTLPVPVKLTTGQAALNPELISNEMNSRGKGQAAPVSPDFYNAQGKALATNLDVLRSKVAPDVPATLHPTDAGQTLIDQYKAMDAPVRADISARYKALEQANGGQFPLNGKDFVSAADQSLAAKNKARYLPSEIQGDLADLRDGGPMTFNSFENLRTTLAAAGRKADRAGDGNASHAISLVRDSLESLPMNGEAANIKPLADAARSAAKARFDALAADPAYKAAAGDTAKAGEPSPLADRFVQNYLINGKGANVRNMKANLAGSDIAKQTIAAAGMDYLKGVAKADPNTGTFAADSYNKGLKQLGPKMGDIFDPETAQHVQQVGNVAKYTSAAPRGAFVNSSNSTTALGSPATQAAITAAKTAAEHGTNMAFGGIPVGTGIRKLSQIVGASKEAKAAAADSKASTDPLAGFKKLSDLPKR